MFYMNTPSIVLSQLDDLHIAIAEVEIEFADGHRARYNPRTIEFAGEAGVWYYVTIGDPDGLGDRDGIELDTFAEPNHYKCGIDGFIYLGALQAGNDPINERVVPGGWPAPCHILVSR